MTDADALDAIHAWLNGKLWSSDTLDHIAEILESTGRVIATPVVEDYDDE